MAAAAIGSIRNPPRKVSAHIWAGYPNPQPLKLWVVCPDLDVAAGWGFAVAWDSAVGCGSAVGLNKTYGLEFAAGVLNAPGEAGYPC